MPPFANRRFFAALPLAALLLAAPATAAETLESLSRDVERAGQDLSRLQGQTIQLAQANLNANSIEQRFIALEAEIRRLTGQVERLGYTQRQLADRMDRFQSDAEFRLTKLEGGDPTALPSTPSTTQSGALTGTGAGTGLGTTQTLGSVSAQELSQIRGLDSGSQPLGAQNNAGGSLGQQSAALPAGSVEDQYNYAFGLVRKGDFTGAQAAMSSFIAQHPNDPLTANAKYWLGETYYARGNYSGASQAFAQAYQDHPTGAKAADSLLKLGLSLSLLGQSAQACQVLQEIEARMGTSAAANILQRAQRERANLGC
ncbi:MAG: tol-pal system protein YbgF [Rhodospirillales bacterium]